MTHRHQSILPFPDLKWAAFLLVALCLPALARAAGIDCAKAALPAEKAICADPWLLARDVQLSTLYGQIVAHATPKQKQAWQKDQRQWLTSRNECANGGVDVICLRRSYTNRLTILRHAGQPFRWNANWWRVNANGMNSAALRFTHVTPKQMNFSLSANHGANTGELNGTAVFVDAGTARYTGNASSGTENCSLVFQRAPDRLQVTQHGADSDCGAGLGVLFDGDYLAAARDPDPKSDLLALGVVQTAAQDEALHQLLGKDYDTMIGTAGGVVTMPASGHGITVTRMFVAGLACNTKSVLMSDHHGHLWAAVWDPQAAQTEVRYYTNVPKDRHTLPKDIAEEKDNACPGDDVRVRMMR